MVEKTIKSLGVPISISMASGSTIKTSGVFTTEKKTSETADPLALTSPITVGSAVCYIPATSRIPSVGDDLTGNSRSYNITEVEGYRPGNVVIAYKLTVQ